MSEIFIRVGDFRVTLCERAPLHVNENTMWHLQFYDMVSQSSSDRWFTNESLAIGTVARWLVLEQDSADDVFMANACLKNMPGIGNFLS